MSSKSLLPFQSFFILKNKLVIGSFTYSHFSIRAIATKMAFSLSYVYILIFVSFPFFCNLAGCSKRNLTTFPAKIFSEVNIMHTVVKYHNSLNDISFSLLTKSENKIFKTVLTYVINQGTREITIPFNELKLLIDNTRHISNGDLSDYLISLYNKLNTIFFFEYSLKNQHTRNDTKNILLFKVYYINENIQTLTVAVNNHFTYLFNDLKNNFTYYRLDEFISLKSKYAMCLYPKLMQFRSTGELFLEFDKFCKLFGITNSLKKNVNNRILSPTCEEINSLFPNLNLRYIKHQKRNNSIDFIKFTFQKK